MKARYTSTCPHCTDEILKGAEIEYATVNDERKAVHRICAEDLRNPFRKRRQSEQDLTERWR